MFHAPRTADQWDLLRFSSQHCLLFRSALRRWRVDRKCSNARRGEFSDPSFKIKLYQYELGWRFTPLLISFICPPLIIFRPIRSTLDWFTSWLLEYSGYYMTACLTFNNSTFCPHSVFMCFVWIWKQTAIISLYSINWLVCITEMDCIYCEVRTGLYI